MTICPICDEEAALVAVPLSGGAMTMCAACAAWLRGEEEEA